MQAEEIGLLLKQDRGQFLEFISAYEYRRAAGQKKREEELAREIVRVLSGMANADGGTVLVGVALIAADVVGVVDAEGAGVLGCAPRAQPTSSPAPMMSSHRLTMYTP